MDPWRNAVRFLQAAAHELGEPRTRAKVQRQLRHHHPWARMFGLDLGPEGVPLGRGRLRELDPPSDAVALAVLLREHTWIDRVSKLRTVVDKEIWRVVEELYEHERAADRPDPRLRRDWDVLAELDRGARYAARSRLGEKVDRWLAQRDGFGFVPLFVPDIASAAAVTVIAPPSAVFDEDIGRDQDAIVAWLRTGAGLRHVEGVLGQHRGRARFHLAGPGFLDFVDERHLPFESIIVDRATGAGSDTMDDWEVQLRWGSHRLRWWNGDAT